MKRERAFPNWPKHVTDCSSLHWTPGHDILSGVPGEPLPVSSEKDVFDIIGMDYKTPEERNA